MNLTGMILSADRLPGSQLPEIAQQAEAMGLESLWVPEVFGREPFVTASVLLQATQKLRVASGIANVYVRDAMALRAARDTLAELSGGRFILGLGVSNTQGNQLRGHKWIPPVTKLEQVFDGMDTAPLMFKQPHTVPVHVAGHGPKLLNFAKERADGALVYLQTLDFTREARATLADKELNVVQICVVNDNPEEARRIARRAIAIYLTLPNYHRAWLRAGFTTDDFADGGSDRLVDALVAWGPMASVKHRLQAHREAGASRILIIPTNLSAQSHPDWEILQELIVR